MPANKLALPYMNNVEYVQLVKYIKLFLLLAVTAAIRIARLVLLLVVVAVVSNFLITRKSRYEFCSHFQRTVITMLPISTQRLPDFEIVVRIFSTFLDSFGPRFFPL